MTAHNQWLSKTRSIPHRTTSVFSSTVTDEERRTFVHSFSWSELTSRRTEYRSLSRTVRLLLSLFVAAGTCLPNRCLAIDYSAFSLQRERVNFMASRCLAMDHSGFQASRHNIIFSFLFSYWHDIRNHTTASVVKWSGFLATDPEVRVRSPGLPHFLRSSGSVTGSTQPREDN
jgi:hypothetical protein